MNKSYNGNEVCIQVGLSQGVEIRKFKLVILLKFLHSNVLNTGFQLAPTYPTFSFFFGLLTFLFS